MGQDPNRQLSNDPSGRSDPPVRALAAGGRDPTGTTLPAAGSRPVRRAGRDWTARGPRTSSPNPYARRTVPAHGRSTPAQDRRSGRAHARLRIPPDTRRPAARIDRGFEATAAIVVG